MSRGMQLHAVSPGVTFVEGPASNWVVLVGDGEVALIDSGYPADLSLVRKSIAEAGGEDLPLTAVLITHGHSDHIGGAGALARLYGARVLASQEELPNVRREITEQIGVPDLLPSLWRPRVLRWALEAVRAGGLGDVGVVGAEAWDGPLVVAGTRVVPILLAGHTRGHTAYLLPDAGAIATGDALVSAHPTSTVSGPQLLPDMFHADPALARAALDALGDQPACIILPGHGPLLREDPATAAGAARRLA
jgi:glyoxylase-like metal-dependent hydrolase (beta-lactamase superfamily II)